ncbi:MAG: hypothetical protein SGCHY_001255 [Lobulomycetales sp.]
MLSSEQLAQFQRDGYLAVQDFFNPAQLKKRVDGLLEEYVPTEHTETRFTSDDDNHVGNDYFLSSGDQIRYFLEPGASVDTDPSKTINKIGHGLHYKDKLFRAFTTQPKLAEVARQLGFRAPHILQSMVICKQPGIGAPVPAHVDSTFLYTDPPSAIGFWYVHTNMLTIRFALEDATLENGCMHFCPGSHTLPLRKRFVRDKKSKEGTCMRYINEGVREPLDSEYVLTLLLHF